jgi:prepilin-type N-terminal cleavage/methylation domain-containing protein
VVSGRRVNGAGQKGFSLIEMLVATAIFAIAAAVAFLLYSAAQKSYKSGENFTDQQQSTRVAFDRMLSDIRLAGFNTNPDGDSTRVDEQIEGAWDTAVTVRGDFDFEDPTASTTPESSLPGTAYNVVSTGNDEIVTYALAKPGNSGPTGSDTLTLLLDASKPRTKTVSTVTIPNVVVLQNDPPYTLYRITLKDVAGAFPGSPQASSNFIYEPVADNIRTMTFRYYDDQGTMLNNNTPAVTTDDIGGGSGTAEIARSRIRRVTVSLVGMTQDPDLKYFDPTDASATTHYRKFSLQSDVNPENLGKSGVKDIDVTPPPTPTGISLVAGHCGGVLVKWNQPASSDGVSSYSVKEYPSGSPSAFTVRGFTYPHYEYGTIDYEGHAFYDGLMLGSTYCFQVQAKDSAGNQSGWGPTSSPPCIAVSEASTPGIPQNVQATGNGTLSPLDSKVTVTWNEVQANTNVVTNDPDTIGGFTIMRDTKGYRLYRDTTSTVPIDAGHLIADTNLLPKGTVTFDNTANVVNCQTYYYKVVMVDTCDVVSGASAVATGQAVTTLSPSTPTNVGAARLSKDVSQVTFDPVTTKTDASSTYIGQYRVYRAKATTGTPAGSISSGSYVLRGTATPTSPAPAQVTYNDNLDNPADNNDLNKGYSFYYVVTALDLCGHESARSVAATVSCAFSGTLSVSPPDGQTNGGSIPMLLTVTGSQTYTIGRARIVRNSDGVEVYNAVDTSYPFNDGGLPDWNTTLWGAGDYTIYWEVENSRGCVGSLTTIFHVAANLACQITPTNPNLSPTSGKPSSQNKKLSWDIINNSGKTLTINSLDVAWTSVICVAPGCIRKLTSVEYPTGTTQLTDLGTGKTTTAVVNFTGFPPPTLPSAATINMSLLWDVQIVNTSNVGEDVTITYHFTDTTSATGTCTFTVKPDLTFTGP